MRFFGTYSSVPARATASPNSARLTSSASATRRTVIQPGAAPGALKLADRADRHPGTGRERFGCQTAIFAQPSHGSSERRIGR